MLKGKTVLIVDDDERNVFALSAVLRTIRPKIITASDGIDCIEKLKANRDIDIVLLDMMMPDMDGYETIKQIRSDDTLKNIPIISLTALAMSGDKEKCIEAGANDYCSKPVDFKILLSKIQTLLDS